MPVIATLVANRRESPALNNIRSPSGLTVIALVSPRFSNLDRHCGQEPALAEGVSSVHWFSVVIPNPKTTMYVHENLLLRNPPDDPRIVPEKTDCCPHIRCRVVMYRITQGLICYPAGSRHDGLVQVGCAPEVRPPRGRTGGVRS